jgi:diaminopimelate decarboxylase
MSLAFEKRLHPILPAIIARFGTPFHIYDEVGILENGQRLNAAFSGVPGFREHFAVKALPNPAILKILAEQLDFGFDCSSIPELSLSEDFVLDGEHIVFTSNNTTPAEFLAAMKLGAVINLDDISFVDKFPSPFPELVSFRYNPGPDREGNTIIGEPENAKYGITTQQIMGAYTGAQQRGAKRFGLHTMVCSNQLNYRYMVATVDMLLEIAQKLKDSLGIQLEFINMGGGIGIPYRPGQEEFDIEMLGRETQARIEAFREQNGFAPAVHMESGRYITGPHGALVTTAINRKDIYQTHVGIDASMAAMMRHAIYNVYHHITVPFARDPDDLQKVNIVGPICENCDRMATDITLPRIHDGDTVIVHDTGAHGIAMGFNYNGRMRPKELLLCADGSVRLIRREETVRDLFATLEFAENVWTP